MKQKNYLRVFVALIAIMLMSVFANTVFGVGVLPCASVLMAGSILLSFVPQTNVCLQVIVPSIFNIGTYGYPIKRAPKYVSKRFPGASRFGSAAYLTDAEIAAEKAEKEKKDKEGQVEVKTAADVLKFLNETKAALEETLKSEVKAEVKESTEAKLLEIEKKVGEVKGLPEGVTPEQLKQAIEDINITIKMVDRMNISMKSGVKQSSSKREVKSFNDILGDTIDRYADKIKSIKKGESLNMDMMPEVKEVDKDGNREVKDVGDMSIAANFPAAGQLFQDVGPLIESPYNRVWLADVLPGGTSNGTQLVYPKENGGSGGAAVWEDPNTDKPQIDYNLTAENGYFKWIAGIVIVDRDMLDDIAFLRSYLQNKMLISLKTAENAFILNGTTGTKPVPGLLTVASPYNGSFTNQVDRIIDAAYGQIVDATSEFYQGTTTVLRPRDAVKIGLNKSTGSGEYDLPAGSVAFSNGKLTIGGLAVVPTTQIAFDTFLSFDKNATMFVKRMQPELRLFEDAALAKKNKVMFRIEERATTAIFNNAAIVKGVLQLS